MKEELTAILDKHRPRLARELDINGGILNRLLANGIITADHLDDIKAEPTPRKRSEMLLDKLKTRDNKCYDDFHREVYKEQKDLAEQCLPLQEEYLPFPKEEQSGGVANYNVNLQ